MFDLKFRTQLEHLDPVEIFISGVNLRASYVLVDFLKTLRIRGLNLRATAPSRTLKPYLLEE